MKTCETTTRQVRCAFRGVARGVLLVIAAGLVAMSLMSFPGSAPLLAQGPREFYASPTGLATNNGSLSSPFSLAHALSSSSPARGGDTIWLLNGTYVGTFTSNLRGTSGAPIIVRQYPGARATIDANIPNPSSPHRTAPALTVNGSDTWFWGFEVTDTNPGRWNVNGYGNPVLRATSINVYGPRVKFINLVVHDGEQGFGFWSTATDSEIYGSIIYNVGVDAPDRGHGHGIYTQNATGTKRIVDNILVNGFSFGIHAYTEGGAIDFLHFEGNTVLNAGVLSKVSGAKADILLGGGKIARSAVIQDNSVYYGPNLGGRGMDLGWGTACDRPSVFNNFMAGGNPFLMNCSGAAVMGNTIYGPVSSALKTSFPNNTYHTTRPTSPWVDVRPNTYEPRRGHVIIYNWPSLPQVQVDLSPLGLRNGDTFEVRDAQNFFGPPVTSGTFTGAAVAIPMTGLTPVQPIGNAPVPARHTAPEFGAFVVLPSSGSSPWPGASLSATPASVSQGQLSTLNWTTSGATTVTIDQGIGTVPATGSIGVTPATTTTYTLSATNGAGTVTRSAQVTVTAPGATATFNASPASVSPGGTSTLSWVTTNATSVSIDHGIGTVPATGSIGVTPATTTTYTLSATNGAGTVTRSAQVTVTAPGPTGTFSASPSTVSAGGTSTLTWLTTNATAVSIDQGVGSVGTNGSLAVSPPSSRTYTLTATGPGGSITRTAAVTVQAASPLPPGVQDITASGTPIALITAPRGGSNKNLAVIKDGVMPPVGTANYNLEYDTYTGDLSRTFDWVGHQFAGPQTFVGLTFQEGMQFYDGGWFTSLIVQVRSSGVWTTVSSLSSTPAYAGANGRSFDTYALAFPPAVGDAIRVAGTPGGSARFISIGELRVNAQNAAAAVTLSGPNGGEVWAPGSARSVTWSAAGASTVNLAYRTSASGPWIAIASGVSAAAGSYAWTVPSVSTTTARVQVTMNGGISDASDADFTIGTVAATQDVTLLGTPIALITAPTGTGSRNIAVIRDGVFPPANGTSLQQYDTYRGGVPRSVDWIGYQFTSPRTFVRLTFQEGRQFFDGGWFQNLSVEVLSGGVWTPVTGLVSTPAYPGANGVSYEQFDLTFSPVLGDAIRITGAPGGTARFVSVGELRVIATP